MAESTLERREPSRNPAGVSNQRLLASWCPGAGPIESQCVLAEILAEVVRVKKSIFLSRLLAVLTSKLLNFIVLFSLWPFIAESLSLLLLKVILCNVEDLLLVACTKESLQTRPEVVGFHLNDVVEGVDRLLARFLSVADAGLSHIEQIWCQEVLNLVNVINGMLIQR